MTGIDKYNSPAKVQRIGNDWVYGNGNDGNVTIASNTVLSRDMYYQNLTINANVQLDPNGYKIFVKNSLTLNGNIALGSNVSTKTVAGSGQDSSGNLNYSIGGNAASNIYQTTKLTNGQKNDLIHIINGVVASTPGSFDAITAGAGGAKGTLTPATSGGTGPLNRNALQPGGPGTAGTTPPQANGGVGGGVIFISAKIITGSGYLITNGTNADPSATGSNGTAAPSATLSHTTDNYAHYQTGDGTGPHQSIAAGQLPHAGHLPALTAALNGHTYRHVHRGYDHGRYHDNYNYTYGPAGHYTHSANSHGSHSGGDYGHTWNAQPSSSPDNANFYHINSIPHSYPHRSHTGVAYTTDVAHHGNGDVSHGGGTANAHYGSYSDTQPGPHYHIPAYHNKTSYGAEHGLYYYPINHQDINYTHTRNRAAGTRSTAGSNTYPGGSAGVAGSTTAGKSGGGGGILIITDSIANTISTNTNGGTVGGISGETGTVVTILNI